MNKLSLADYITAHLTVLSATKHEYTTMVVASMLMEIGELYTDLTMEAMEDCIYGDGENDSDKRA